jgi:hypothetical protein
MSATARAMLGCLKIADNAVSASFVGVLDADRETQIAGQAVARVIEFPVQRRVPPIKLVSRTDSAARPEGQYISLDLEDFQ